MHPLLKKIREGKNPFAIDAPLPEGRWARAATITGLVLGGLVALLVPVVLAVMVAGLMGLFDG